MSRNQPKRMGATLLASASLACTVALAAPQGPHCERSCLKGLMDQYLAALVAHDPSRLPVAPGVRFTENTNRMSLGDGLWQTIDGLGTFKLYIEDPASGQAAFYGTASENGVTALLGVRLKERGRRLTEIEQFVVRQASGIHGSFDRLVTADPLWEEPVPESERSSRAALIDDADQYFNGIVRGDGDIVPFAEDCVRIENGAQTAPAPATATRPAVSARAQFNARLYAYIHEITNRRFLLVDPERGIVYAVVMFQHPGDIRPPARRAAGAPRSGFSLASYPNTTEIIETFKIRGGKIHDIFAYVSLLPYRQRPGW
ncbi:MAG TPA: hypothetical protein VMU67_04225 [Steroidobacteraceae bacterium]|nr:hypothetical protein [Steroidobacteraceae bacterium]